MTPAITELRTVSWHQCDNFIVLTLDKAYTLYFLLVSEIFEATLNTLWPFLGEIWNNLSLYKKIVSESSEAVFFYRLWEKSETTFIKVFRKFLKQHFVTVFNLEDIWDNRYRNCFWNFWSNILLPSQTVFSKFLKHIWWPVSPQVFFRVNKYSVSEIFGTTYLATRVYTTKFRDTAVKKGASDIFKRLRNFQLGQKGSSKVISAEGGVYPWKNDI